jgi:hypothetical protein
MTSANIAGRSLKPLRLLLAVSPIALLLLGIPYLTNPYQTLILAYGLIMAIAALGFNLLLGYTGLLSFGHSAYFGVGAYAVAFMVKYMHVRSMELFVLAAIPAHGLRILYDLCWRYLDGPFDLPFGAFKAPRIIEGVATLGTKQIPVFSQTQLRPGGGTGAGCLGSEPLPESRGQLG